MVTEDIDDIRRNADIIEQFENIEIINEYDGTVVVPEHMVNYKINHDEENVYLLSINQNGVRQKLTGYID